MEVEIRTLRKGARFHYMDETYRKGERTTRGEFMIYGVSPTAWSYGRLRPWEKVEPIKIRRKRKKRTMKEMLDTWSNRWKKVKPKNEIDRCTRALNISNILKLKLGYRQ